MSVATLLAVPAARGLFQRAILQSGAGAHVHEPDAATAVAQKFLAEVGIAPGEVGSAARRSRCPTCSAAQRRLAESTPFDQGLPLQPVVDGRVAAGATHPCDRCRHARPGSTC